MMLATRLNFGGSPSAQITPGWFGDPWHPVKRLHGQLLGLGMTMDEARTILTWGTAGGYTPEQVAEANRMYYGGTAAGGYQATVQTASAYCGPEPTQPSVSLMSSPNCSPTGTECVQLLQLIEEYNNALQRNAMQSYLRAGCERQNCQNQGAAGYPRDCMALYPAVQVPAQPVYPGAVSVQQTGGWVTGYGTQPIGSTTQYGGAAAGSATSGQQQQQAGSGSSAGAGQTAGQQQSRQSQQSQQSRQGQQGQPDQPGGGLITPGLFGMSQATLLIAGAGIVALLVLKGGK